MSERNITEQPLLFEGINSEDSVTELFPAVWTAMEKLTYPDQAERLSGLNQLKKLKAHQLSPLVAYLLTSFIMDPDITFRFQVVQALGEVFSGGYKENSIPDNVKITLRNFLSQMRRRQIYAILQVAEFHRSAETSVASLLRSCSYAGSTLASIFLDRKIPVQIRRQAINFSGVVGFLDTIPELEKLSNRLESQSNGQQKMAFAPQSGDHEKSLLPTVQTALTLLKFS